jgi:hypothetical protein
LIAATSLDGTRDTLWEQQPPRDDIPVPRIDDAIHALVQKIAFDYSDWHRCPTVELMTRFSASAESEACRKYVAARESRVIPFPKSGWEEQYAMEKAHSPFRSWILWQP